MKTLYAPLIVLFFLSCNARNPVNKENSTSNIDTVLVFSHGDTLHPIPVLNGDLEHTLQMYANRDSFEIVNPEFYLKIFLLNHIKFGIIGDSLFRVYKINGNIPEKIMAKRAVPQLQRFVKEDVNNDGYDDVVIYDNGGEADQELSDYNTRVLIFDPETKTLEHKKNFDVENLAIDMKSHLVRSWHMASSAFGTSFKVVYRNSGDSLELIRSVLYYNLSDKGNITNAIVKTAHLRDGKLIEDSIVTTPSKGAKILDTSLWNSGNLF